MADGEILHNRRGLIVVLLLDAKVATTGGVWVDCGEFGDGSLTVSGITTATLQVRGSDAGDVPADNAHGGQIGTDIVADGLYDIARASRWLKVRITAYTSGTITVTITLRRTGNPVGGS